MSLPYQRLLSLTAAKYTPTKGDRIVVQIDKDEYYVATVTRVSGDKKKFNVKYDDGETDTWKTSSKKVLGPTPVKKKRKKPIKSSELAKWLPEGDTGKRKVRERKPKKPSVPKEQVLNIGDVGVLQKTKHRWNNGKKVTVVEIRDDDEFVVEDDEGQRYIIGLRNFKRDIASLGPISDAIKNSGRNKPKPKYDFSQFTEKDLHRMDDAFDHQDVYGMELIERLNYKAKENRLLYRGFNFSEQECGKILQFMKGRKVIIPTEKYTSWTTDIKVAIAFAVDHYRLNSNIPVCGIVIATMIPAKRIIWDCSDKDLLFALKKAYPNSSIESWCKQNKEVIVKNHPPVKLDNTTVRYVTSFDKFMLPIPLDQYYSRPGRGYFVKRRPKWTIYHYPKK